MRLDNCQAFAFSDGKVEEKDSYDDDEDAEESR
jgi:hypothetical protein